MNATPSNTPSDLIKLRKQLGEDNADAVAEFFDGRIGGLRDELTELVKKQAENIQVAKASGRPEDAAIANAGTRVVQDADQAVKAAEADPTPDKAAEARDKVEEAAQVVDETESELTGRVTRVERRLGSNNERDSFEGVRQRVCDLEESHGSLQSAVAYAVAFARSGGDGGVARRASKVALTVFGLVAVIYWLIWWPSRLDYDLLVNLGLAFGAGGLAGWIALLWWGDDGAASASAGASASAYNGGGQRNVGLDILDDDRQVAAGASAHAHH